MALLLDAFFLSVASSHLVVDILNGSSSTLFAYLSGPLGLTNATLGLVGSVYLVSGSLMQPIFGYLADRIGARWVVSGGVLWMALFFSLGLVVPGRGALVLLVLASLGSGAFHPAGAMQASNQGRQASVGREMTATSFFFTFGQLGLFLGPLAGGVLLDSFGVPGLLALTALAVPVGLNAGVRLRESFAGPARAEAPPAGRQRGLKVGLGILVAFGLLTALRSWTQQSMVVFIPKYLADIGLRPSLYGALAALFMGGSAIGNVIGGSMADRYGRRRVAVGSLFVGALPVFLIPLVGWSPWLYVLIPLAGGLNGASHSILVVYAQDLIPGGMALASGLVLGFMFSSGALGALLSGVVADQWGLAMVFPLTGLASLIAALFTFPLRANRTSQ